MKYRPSLFNNVLTPINSNASENWLRNWFKSEAQQSFIIRKTDSKNTSKSTEAIVYINSKCCFKDHISEFSAYEKKEILNYYKSMKTNDRRNKYSKSVVLPVDVMQRTVSGKDSQRTQKFEYFVRIQDKETNFPTLKQINKKAFIEFQQITESRLRPIFSKIETKLKT